MSYILLTLNKPANYKQSFLNTYLGHESFNLCIFRSTLLSE